MRRILWSIVGVMIISLTVLSIIRATQRSPAPANQRAGDHIGLAPPATTSVGAVRFLEMCTGITIKDEAVRLIAVSNCLGRIRGFADGHLMTVRLADASGKDGLQLFCIDEKQTDRQVYEAVAGWVAMNPVRFDEIAIQYQSPATAAMAINVAALHAAFPCEKQ